jgi:phosphoglycerate kinase
VELRSVRDAQAAGKRVFVRVDFNVPLDGATITDDTRIRSSLPTIELLLAGNAKVILASHLGRPKGKVNPAYSLAPVARRLGELLGRPVQLASDVAGPDAVARAASLAAGDVLLLENLRFEPGEEANDAVLARQLAGLADLYINDAFGAAHRAHASTVGVAELLPAYAGLLMAAEIAALQRLVHNPERPFVAILGGAKVSDKIGVIKNLLPNVDRLLVGGGMANTFLAANGIQIGSSLCEPELLEDARSLLERARSLGVPLHLPVDVVVAASLDGAPETVDVGAIAADRAIFDIGPATAKTYAGVMGPAKTLFWNGPMGVFERPAFAGGTRAVAAAVAESGAYSVIGGGDSVAAVEQMHLADRISHISTGGGASLEYIEGRALPGIEALRHARET